MDNWVIFGWGVDQWDYNVQYFHPLTHFSCHPNFYHCAISHLKHRKVQIGIQDRICIYLYNWLMCYHCASSTAEPNYLDLHEILHRLLQQLWRSPQTCDDLCMLSWTVTMDVSIILMLNVTLVCFTKVILSYFWLTTFKYQHLKEIYLLG
jgi:hypothetical protein